METVPGQAIKTGVSLSLPKVVEQPKIAKPDSMSNALEKINLIRYIKLSRKAV